MKLRATDDDGNAVTDNLIVRVEKDPPVPVISGLSVVPVGVEFSLGTVGSTPGKFGRIAKYEWSFGDVDNFTAASGKDTILPLPAAETMVVALRITDDDGNTTIETKSIGFLKQWVKVGNPAFSAGEARNLSLAFASGTPYLAFTDGSGATVMRYDGANWVNVGSPGFSLADGRYISLAFASGMPYVAYSDLGIGWRASVKRFDGTDWVNVGSQGVSSAAAEHINLVISSGIPYVGLRDDGVAKVMRFTGTSWVSVGGPAVPSGAASFTSLAITSNKIHLAYQDESIGNRATVVIFK